MTRQEKNTEKVLRHLHIFCEKKKFEKCHYSSITFRPRKFHFNTIFGKVLQGQEFSMVYYDLLWLSIPKNAKKNLFLVYVIWQNLFVCDVKSVKSHKSSFLNTKGSENSLKSPVTLKCNYMAIKLEAFLSDSDNCICTCNETCVHFNLKKLEK